MYQYPCYTLRENEDTFKAFARLKANGVYPESAFIGGRVVENNKPHNAIAEIQIRAGESLWILDSTEAKLQTLG